MAATGNYARLNALVDSGALADLTAMEVRALMVYLRHAVSETGIAWPSLQTVADRISPGSKRRARQAIASLVKKGRLELVERGGGRKNPSKYRVVTPETCPESGHVTQDETCPHSENKRARIRKETCPDLDNKRARNPGTEQTIEQTNEQTTQQQLVCEVDPSDARVVNHPPQQPGSDLSQHHWDRVREWLRDEGLSEAEIDRAFQNHPGAEGFEHFKDVWKYLKRKENGIKSRAGFLRSMMRPGASVDLRQEKPARKWDEGWPNPCDTYVLTREAKDAILDRRFTGRLREKLLDELPLTSDEQREWEAISNLPDEDDDDEPYHARELAEAA